MMLIEVLNWTSLSHHVFTTSGAVIYPLKCTLPMSAYVNPFNNSQVHYTIKGFEEGIKRSRS
jgi:hypothetical protein